MLMIKFPSTSNSSVVLSFESEIVIAFVKTIKSSGDRLSKNVLLHLLTNNNT